MARRPKPAKLVANDRLREYVQDRLSGVIRTKDGTVVAGPVTPQWKGRNKARRQDRRWASAWSPEQIATRLPIDFPDDESMRISHEAIYQALFIQGRGALRRDLVACLRTGRALRVPRARSKGRPNGHVSAEVMISERPAEAEDRAVPGHWEGDLIIGLERSAIGTLVERATRFTMLVHLPRMAGYGIEPRTKNGPALAGYGAIAMKDALAIKVTELPEQLPRSLTWDRGKELAQHAQLKIETGLPVYFADPHSPWQRGTNENTNGLLRQYFPKGTDLSRWRAEEIEAVAAALNSSPARPSEGGHPRNPWTSTYDRFNTLVLHPPVEPGLGAGVGVVHQPVDDLTGAGPGPQRHLECEPHATRWPASAVRPDSGPPPCPRGAAGARPCGLRRGRGRSPARNAPARSRSATEHPRSIAPRAAWPSRRSSCSGRS